MKRGRTKASKRQGAKEAKKNGRGQDTAMIVADRHGVGGDGLVDSSSGVCFLGALGHLGALALIAFVGLSA